MDELVKELHAISAEAPDFTPRELKNPNNRWIVRSAFQKAIRRGQLDRALRMGEYLLVAEGAFPWQALATVIVEDVGFGDLDLLAMSTVTTLKSLRDHTHEELLFAAMIKRACAAPKSRSCCELDLGVNMRLHIEASAEQASQNLMQDFPDEAVYAVMLQQSQKVGDLAAAHIACRMARKRLRGKGEDALLPSLQMIMEALDDPVEQRAAMMSFERTVDSMNLALFPILLWLNRVNKPIQPCDEKVLWPESIEVMSVASEAFDMHTRDGKKAIKAFYTSMKQDYPWVAAIEPDAAVRALGSLIFIVEGGMLDVRLRHEGLDQLKAYQDSNFAIGYGVPAALVADQFQQVLGDVFSEIPRLNAKRKWAAGE